MADLFWPAGEQFFDDNGDPLNAGTIAFYDATTTTPRTVYKDSAAGTAWGTSLTLNSAGRLTDSVYVVSGAWKYVLASSAGSIIATVDSIPGALTVPSFEFGQPVLPIITKASDYTVVVGDLGKKINVDATGGDVTITMPTALAAGDGGFLAIQNVGASGSVVINKSGGDTINGGSSIRLRAKDDAVDLVADGAAVWTGNVTADFRTNASSKTTSYTVLQSDLGRIIPVNATSGALTVNLPPAATVGSGFWVMVQKTDSSANAVTLDGNSTETINGATTYALQSQWDIVGVQSDGSNWTLRGASVTPRTVNLDNTGLSVKDTNASHSLNIKPGSDLTANRTLTVTTGDADRTLNISAASVTVSSFAATVLDDADAATMRATLEIVAFDVYTGSTSGNQSYPIGAVIGVYGTPGILNSSASLTIRSGSFEAEIGGGGSALAGTWRSSGRAYSAGDQGSIYRRVA